jgi:hypothetical protein
MRPNTLPLSLLLSIFFGFALPGCAQDAANLQSVRAQTASILQQAESTRDVLKQQLTTRPADDPLRQHLQPEIDQLDQIITRADSYLPLLDAAIRTAQSQPIDPQTQQAVSVIPYGSLALAVISIIFGIIKHVQAGNLIDQQQQVDKAFTQLVAAVDTALPVPTADQKAKMDSVLDADVKAKVAAARV